MHVICRPGGPYRENCARGILEAKGTVLPNAVQPRKANNVFFFSSRLLWEVAKLKRSIRVVQGQLRATLAS